MENMDKEINGVFELKMPPTLKILNLYCGIGGNRKLWKNVDVTAVEYNPNIAKIYEDLFPDDKVIVTDAHQYLLNNFKDFDFIWSSPPCPSHSCIRKTYTYSRNDNEPSNKPLYPDMKLYEEIIFLQGYFKGKFCVENVMPYYKPLIPAKKLERHLLWTNFPLNERKFVKTKKHYDNVDEFRNKIKIDLRNCNVDNHIQIYRNYVDPILGLYVFESAYNKKQERLF